MESHSPNKRLEAEFDLIADDYDRQHQANLKITGEGPAYFARYKVADLADYIQKNGLSAADILDFGCGIGNSIEHFRAYFPDSRLHCADVSKRSMDIARARFPGKETYLHVDHAIDLAPESMDVVFTACVFHHIPHEQHVQWLTELKRIIRPGGLLVIYEHNPLNPLTVQAVNTCPFDANAQLINARAMKKRLTESGWLDAQIRYKLFFPSLLRWCRPLEKYLSWCGFGAQWRLTARKPQ